MQSEAVDAGKDISTQPDVPKSESPTPDTNGILSESSVTATSPIVDVNLEPIPVPLLTTPNAPDVPGATDTAPAAESANVIATTITAEPTQAAEAVATQVTAVDPATKEKRKDSGKSRRSTGDSAKLVVNAGVNALKSARKWFSRGRPEKPSQAKPPKVKPKPAKDDPSLKVPQLKPVPSPGDKPKTPVVKPTATITRK